MEDISDYLVFKKWYINGMEDAFKSYKNDLRHIEYWKEERIKKAEVFYNKFIEKKLKIIDTQRTNKKVFEYINKILPDELTNNIFEYIDGSKEYKRKELNAEFLFYAKQWFWRKGTIKEHIKEFRYDLNLRIFRYKKHEEFMKNVYMVNGKYHIKKEGMKKDYKYENIHHYVCICDSHIITEKGFKAHFNKSKSHHEYMTKKVKNDDRKFINFQDELINNKELQNDYNFFMEKFKAY